MKRLLPVVIALAMLVSPAAAVAATAPDNVLGVPWGATPAAAKQILDQKGFAFEYEEQNVQRLGAQALPAARLLFYRGLYANYRALVGVDYVKDQLVRVRVMVMPSSNGGEYNYQTIGDDLFELLSGKYGPPTKQDSQPVGVMHPPPEPQKTAFWDWTGSTRIVLSRMPLYSFATGDEPQPSQITVAYYNYGLHEDIKKKMRDNF